MQKQFQSNTLVPNKSTMVEEDDDPVMENAQDNSYGLGLDRVTSNRENDRSVGSQRSNVQSEVTQDMYSPGLGSGANGFDVPQTDKKLIEDYQQQVRELRERLDSMEDAMKRKDDELNSVLDGERSRATAANLEKKELSDMRLRLENQIAQADDVRANLENQLAQADDFNASLRKDMERMRPAHENEVRELQDQIARLEGEVDQARQEARQATMNMSSMNANRGKSGNADPQLRKENEELKAALKEQQAVTDEVRRSAQESLREMRMLSQKSNSAYERHDELEKTVESLEREVRDWRNRYARTKTQLRNMRASSLGLTIEQDAARYVRDKGFTQENGLVKDVHVTKFQISIDELLQKARTDDPERITDAMKRVVVSVRTITKDIDDSGPKSDDVMQEQSKLKAKVSSAANNFITASKNFANSAGISPVSLLDAAASHLVAAIVDLLKTVKIRATPAGELDDDDDGTITPVDSTGFFSPRSNGQSSMTTQETLPPPPPFQGLGGNRGSADSSAYSPISSPRESVDPAFNRRPMSRGGNAGMNGTGLAYMGFNKNLPPAPTSNPYGNMVNGTAANGRNVEDLKIYLEDQTAVLVQSIQSLVGSIRGDAEISQITKEISDIVAVVDKVIEETDASGNGALSQRLGTCRDRLLDAADRGSDIAAKGKGSQDREWRMWTQTLPPIAFEIARETKELRQKVDQIAGPGGDDQFS
jgi:predicted  nucleic acid-binding Zn-ribbon protein